MDFHDLKTDIVYDKDKGSWKLTIEAWGQSRQICDQAVDLLEQQRSIYMECGEEVEE